MTNSLLAAFNDALHEHTAFFLLFHALWWTIIFGVLTTAVAIPWIWISALTKVAQTYLQPSSEEATAVDSFHRAVVITGCDTGFGKNLAFQAADKGYHVFVGCLQADSCSNIYADVTNITAVECDVTKDEHVTKLVGVVEKWLKDTNDNKKKRVLHCLINNAGICMQGDIDWLDVKAFQLSLEGRNGQVERVSFVL